MKRLEMVMDISLLKGRRMCSGFCCNDLENVGIPDTELILPIAAYDSKWVPV